MKKAHSLIRASQASTLSVLSYLRERVRRKGMLDSASSVARRFNLPTVSRFLTEIARHRHARAGQVAPFRVIQIETLGYCNLSCSFCPTNQIKMPKGRMTDALFDRLIGQLSEFDGTIGLYLRNEPLLDKRMVRFARKARSETRARIVIQTNGVLLTEELAGDLSEVAHIQVNDYSGGKELRRLAPVMKRYGIIGIGRSNPRGLSNRAGNLPGAGTLTQPLSTFCVRPFEQLYVAFDGRVVLCCQDWKLEEEMGNANYMTLADIWKVEDYRLKRAELLDRRRRNLCAACDFPGV
ncbi:SPASM domain-containing protein [Roseibium sp. AS2]|uniref:radical SAM/SPASM domain-containing protein n=1 Tax=Roseibium sp. AS2 TaxID=3135781 RepID=UPI00317A0F0D